MHLFVNGIISHGTPDVGNTVRESVAVNIGEGTANDDDGSTTKYRCFNRNNDDDSNLVTPINSRVARRSIEKLGIIKMRPMSCRRIHGHARTKHENNEVRTNNSFRNKNNEKNLKIVQDEIRTVRTGREKLNEENEQKTKLPEEKCDRLQIYQKRGKVYLREKKQYNNERRRTEQEKLSGTDNTRNQKLNIEQKIRNPAELKKKFPP